ncbi:MAG: M23 family metallopeptidase [Saccharofermentanales bacterium]
MKKTRIIEDSEEIRKASMGLFPEIKMNRALSFAVSGVLIVAIGIFGFSIGSYSAETKDELSGSPAYDKVVADKISSQEIVCLEIESVDKQIQNDVLREENESIKEESETITDKILGALMDNLESKKLASRSYNIDSYIKEAKNLLQLQVKLNTFKKSEDYGTVDITEYEKSLSERFTHIPTLKPIPGTFGGYGWRIHPIYKYKHFHPAADQGAPTGTPVKAAASGYVVRASYDRSSGNFVVLNHGNGFVTTYMHHSKNLVSAGQWVKQGEVIAKVGNTGSSTHPHLHFEVTFNGSPLDPRRILMQ